MAASAYLQRPIRLRRDEETEDYETSASEVDDESENSSASGPDSQTEDDLSEAGSAERDDSVDQDEELPPSESLKDISFGALARAQESLGPPSRKRKALEQLDRQTKDQSTPNDDPQNNRNEAINTFQQFKKSRTDNSNLPARTTKNAPAILSSKHAVSRKREVFEPAVAQKFRDPRFDPTILSSTNNAGSREKANRNYAFLTDYQAEEVLNLKTRIKKSKDPEEVAELKREVMSIESKLKSAEHQQREKEILRRHNEKEKEEIRSGKKEKPYFLKAGEVRKLANQERIDAMGKKAREKSEKRKRKREKGKEARLMPRVRRDR